MMKIIMDRIKNVFHELVWYVLLCKGRGLNLEENNSTRDLQQSGAPEMEYITILTWYDLKSDLYIEEI